MHPYVPFPRTHTQSPQSFPDFFLQLAGLGEHLDPSCAKAGVAVVFVPELTGCRTSGATRWLTPTKALIQLNLRYNSDDHLWFSFFHEAGHILLHGKRDAYVEYDEAETSPDEEAANEFARDFLIAPEDYHAFVRSCKSYFSKQKASGFARKLGIAPGIIVGRLQHDQQIPYTHVNALKQRLKRTTSSLGCSGMQQA